MRNKGWVVSSSAIVMFVLLAFLPASHAFTPPSTPFTQCPAVGDDTSCGVLIVVNPDGTVNIYTDSSQGPYDGSEDTLIGVQDNCAACGGVTTIAFSGTTEIFDLDSDGACSGPFNINPLPYPPAADCPGGAYQSFDPTDYETNNVTFTVTDVSAGAANFGPALTSGTHAWFSLEGPITAADISVSTISTTSVSSSSTTSSATTSSTSSSSSSSSSTTTTTSVSTTSSSSSSTTSLSSSSTTSSVSTSSSAPPTGVPQFGMPGVSAVFVAAAAFVAVALLLKIKRPSIPRNSI